MQCPGQDSRYWSGDDVFESKCPHCGKVLEFFKDDSKRRCSQCSKMVMNPKMDFGCAQYCPHAEQCMGSLTPDLAAARNDLFKDKIGKAMRDYFGSDTRRINHAEQVAIYAELIGNEEKGDMAVIMAAAYLHDIGIKEAEHKFNSSSAKVQHQEGPPVARQLLTNLKAEETLIEEACDIIGHHHWPRKNETVNFKVIYDADLIVNLSETYRENPPTREKVEQVLTGSFLTQSGRREGEKVLLAFVKTLSSTQL